MALFNRKDKEEIITTIEINQIVANRYQPRTTFEEESLKELAESIEQYGLIQPIVVRTAGENMYEIVAGERRFRASKIAGLEVIPVIIKDLEAKDSAVLAVIENIQREDLNPIEEAKSYQRLATLLNLTQDEVSKMVGKSQSAIANKMRLLQLPEDIQDALKDKSISERHARALLKFETDAARSVMLEKIIKDNLTVAETERIIEEKLSHTKNVKDVKTKVRIKGYANDVRLAINTVKKSLKTIEKFGHKAEINEQENDSYYEVTIKIDKHATDDVAEESNDLALNNVVSLEANNDIVVEALNTEAINIDASPEENTQIETEADREEVIQLEEENNNIEHKDVEKIDKVVNTEEQASAIEHETLDETAEEVTDKLLINDGEEIELSDDLETKFAGLDISFFDNLKLEGEEEVTDLIEENKSEESENELDITNTFHFVYNANYGNDSHTPTSTESEELFNEVQEHINNDEPIIKVEDAIEEDDLFKTTELNLETTYNSIYESYYNDGEEVEVPAEVLEAGEKFVKTIEATEEKPNSIYNTIYDFGNEKEEKKDELLNWQTLLNDDSEDDIISESANEYQKDQADRVRAMFTEVTNNTSEETTEQGREELDELLEVSRQEAEITAESNEEEAIKYGAKSSFVDKLKNINNTSNSFLFEDEDDEKEENKSNDGFWNLFK
ncbi:ParB/RepB/Spo0J family partition protein [Culicoidibacter larvae]|uniref:ParB/RepB/Spo0J family partition protein n=1 Tax=Culicoidibacter larvae TaxID=2579976 RepID=A0A5R8QHF2_9FIRM|nr:ParB/RepB/Spo0J family partition protein [Culicoidibacter larvae]TLG77166.1 ParB/RepB/Spo0J family partition protein [Culicoidibacter larvae]